MDGNGTGWEDGVGQDAAGLVRISRWCAVIWARQEWRLPRKALAVPEAVFGIYQYQTLMESGTGSDGG